MPDNSQEHVIFPPGTVGETANFIMSYAPRPVAVYALAASIGMHAGVLGRSYQISGTGLNQYIWVVGNTGSGKDIISSGPDAVLAAIVPKVPGAMSFKGPGEIASAAGLFKWLARENSIYSVIGEIGMMLEQMWSGRNPNASSIERAFLQLYSKSGGILDSSAYSDKANNSGHIVRPTFSLMGETVADRLLPLLGNENIASGFTSRQLCFEYRGPRVPPNENRIMEPSPQLAQDLSERFAHSLSLNSRNIYHNIPMNDAANRASRDYNQFCDEKINGGDAEITRELWNRNHLKAVKLAGLVVVGIDYINPVVDYDCFMWASNLVTAQTYNLLSKFENHQVGQEAGDQIKQQTHVRRVIIEYLNAGAGTLEKYDCPFDIHRDQLIPYGYLSRRLIKLPAFSRDKAGGTNALKNTIKFLEEIDEIGQVSYGEMDRKYHTTAKAYGVRHFNTFVANYGYLGRR